MPPQRFEGIARLANERGWHLWIENRRTPPSGWSGDGVLVMLRHDPALERFVRGAVRRGVPVVDMIEECPEVPLPRVTGDNEAIGRLAAEHFAERDFIHAATFSLNRTHVHDIRFGGFRSAWHGETPLEWSWAEAAGGDTSNWAKMNAWLESRLRRAPKPLAVFAWNDYEATHVLNACRVLGIKVPADVAVLGVDDNRLICEHQHVPLSSIRHDHESISYAAAAMLERLMQGRAPETDRLLVRPDGITVRTSTDVFAVNDPSLRPAVDFIDSNLSHPLGARDVAEALGISRIRLDRMFAEKAGRSVGAEISRRRIAAAKRMLASPGATVADVAAACGFCHASFFIKSFRRATGSTPSAWARAEQSGAAASGTQGKAPKPRSGRPRTGRLTP